MSQYKEYLAAKSSVLKGYLADIARGSLTSGIHPTSFINGYRNRAKFKIYAMGTTPVLYGTDPLKGEVEADKMLWILPDWGREVVVLGFQRIAARYSQLPVDGFELQLTHGDRKAHLTLSVHKKHSHDYSELVQILMDEIPVLIGLAIPSQKQQVGESLLPHKLLNREFQAHYSSFFQSNLGLAPVLLQETNAMLSEQNFSGICDLFCGVGLFSLLLGSRDTMVLGIDSHAPAIASARRNARRMGFTRAEFICSDVSEYFPEAEISADDLLIFDPPRTGCPLPVLQKAACSGAHLVLMVSCCLETQIRDIKILQKRGFGVISFAAFDMFPFSDFLETAALLQRDHKSQAS